MPEQPRPDLDALIESARINAAAERSSDTAQAAVVRVLAEGEGFAAVADLLAQGIRRDVLADLVAEPTDKRAKSKALLTVVGGDAYIYLTSTGWASAGRNAKSRPPDTESAAHARSPRVLGEFIAARSESLAARGIHAHVSSGAAMRRFSEEVKARAWAALRATPDAEGSVGLLTGGWIPDALVVSRWPRTDVGRVLYQRCWGFVPSDDDLAESVASVEVQTARRSSDPLRAKVAAAEASVSVLGAVQSVIWVCQSRAVADRLRELGVDALDGRAGRQLLVPARALGLEGDDIGPVQRPWWLLTVPPNQTQA